MQKYLILPLLLLGFAGLEAQAPYTFQKTNCRLEILSASEIRYSLLLEDVRWVDRSGGQQISIYDGVMTMTLRGNEITNYTGGQIDSLKLDLATWRLACLTRVSGDTLFIGSDTILFGASGVNVYTTSSSLTDDRVVTMAGNDLTFNGPTGGNFEISVDPSGDTRDYQMAFSDNFLGFGLAAGGFVFQDIIGANEIIEFRNIFIEGRPLGPTLSNHLLLRDLAESTGNNSTIQELWDLDTNTYDLEVTLNITNDSIGSSSYRVALDSDTSSTQIFFQNIARTQATTTINAVGDAGAEWNMFNTHTGLNGRANAEINFVNISTNALDSAIFIISNFSGGQSSILLQNDSGDSTTDSQIGWFAVIEGTDTFKIRYIHDGSAAVGLKNTPMAVDRNATRLYTIPNEQITVDEIPQGLTNAGLVTYDAPHDNQTQAHTGDGTTTLDWLTAGQQLFQFGAFNETFTFIDPTFAGWYGLELIQDGVGSRLATWPASVDWAGGSAPTLTTTATTGKDYIMFWYDGISTYNGIIITLDLR